MKIVCARNILAENLNIVSRAVASRSAMPILECCLITAYDGVFRLMTNDMDMSIETIDIPADMTQRGSIALEAKVFFDIVRRMPGKDIEISVDEKNITKIKSGISEFKILGSNPEEFPPLPEGVVGLNTENTSGYFGIPASNLRDMIRQTIFSVSTDQSKPTLCGELLEIGENYLRMVSVDGFRISLRGFEGEFPVSSQKKAIVPAKTLSEINKILQNSEEEIQVFVASNHMVFKFEHSTIVSRLLDGEFIKYENMFSSDTGTKIWVERAKLLESVDRATLISRDAKKNPVKLKLEDGVIVITSNTELGASYEEVEVRQEGAGLEIAFNPRYLTDILKAVDEEEILMRFTGSLSPCIVEPVEDILGEYKYLVLPLRLR